MMRLPTTFGILRRALAAVALLAAAPLAGQVLPPSMSGSNQVTKISVYRGQYNQQAVWYVNSNGDHQTTGQTFVYGLGGDTPVLGDWTNTAQLNLGVFHDGLWYLDLNGSGAWEPGIDNFFSFGLPGDIGVMGDWDHTGKLRIGVVRNVGGAFYWYVNLHTCAERNGYGCQWGGQYGTDSENLGVDYAVYQFGLAGDIPVMGDWDHTGRLRIGVYRSGTWIVDQDGCNCYDGNAGFYYFGVPGDQPTVGRWTGGSDATHLNLGILRSGQWIVDANGDRAYNGPGYDGFYSFGVPGDIPAVGTWAAVGSQYYLTTAATAGGTISPYCPSPGCLYNVPAQVTVTATPSPGYVFTGFSGGMLSGLTNPQTFTMNGPATVIANFAQQQQYYLTTNVSPVGTGSISPASGWYNAGTQVQITATPASGYVFSGFSGALSGTTNPQNLTMNGPASVTATFTNTLTSTNLTDFQSCIGPAGSVANCVLAQGRYPVNTTLHIQRSGIALMGGGGPGDTTLYRDNANLVQIMVADANVSGVSIENLTFDGNRYGRGLGLRCLMGNTGFYDLDLRAGGTFTVQWMDFINAPGWALYFQGYGSSVSVSNFGQGGYGYAPDGSLRSETGKESATRSTAVWIEGSYNGAWYNAISYAGTAAINLHGSHQYAYGNLLYQNRYEISDGSGGGQLFLDPESSAATVTGNVIDGNGWPQYTQGQPPPSLGTTCDLPSDPQFNAGVEAYGYDHAFFNNEIENNTGSGMQFAGSEPTGRITISSENPSDPSDTPRYIEMNKSGGIVFLGTYSPPWTLSAQGAALYRINVRNNAGFDVDLDGLSNDNTTGYYGVGYHGFVSDSCIIASNNSGPVAGVPGVNGGMPPPYDNTLTHPVPTSYGAYTYNGGTCPDPGWPAQTPARSWIPGWPW